MAERAKNVKNRIVVGAVVQLKSGGPQMTVKRIREQGAYDEEVRCVWFDGNITRGDDFVRAILKIAPRRKS